MTAPVEVPPEVDPVVPPPDDVPLVPAAVELAAALLDAADVAPTEELVLPEDEAAALPVEEPREDRRASPSTIWRQQPLEAPANHAKQKPAARGSC